MSKPVLVNFSVAGGLATVIVSLPVHAGQGPVSADDFLTRLEDGPGDAAQPDKVHVEGEMVEAANAQDAVTQRSQRPKSLAAGDDDGNRWEIHARLVKFPSGIGVVASGVAGDQDGGTEY